MPIPEPGEESLFATFVACVVFVLCVIILILVVGGSR
jgi:hypothetical protein